jgi:hypothetical protein
MNGAIQLAKAIAASFQFSVVNIQLEVSTGHSSYNPVVTSTVSGWQKATQSIHY